MVRDGRPDVFAHNVEVVPRLQRSMRDARCSWQRSIEVLRWARAAGANVTKSSLMVGCGESRDEVLEAMALLREAEVDVLTIGQYLRPTPKHAEVVRYVDPSEFESYREAGMELGFKYVAAGPLVRSSYRAAEGFLSGILRGHDAPYSRRSLRQKTSGDRELMEVHESYPPSAIPWAADKEVVAVLDLEGRADPSRDPRLELALARKIYEGMLRARLIDVRLTKLQRQGRIGFHVGAEGEEAAIIASAAAMRAQDWLFPCYRESGAALYRGYPLQTYVDNMYGNANDVVKGRQMPDHITSRDAHFGSVTAPIGTQITQAVGFAWAAKLKKEDVVTGVYFGDGATSSNDFHAGMNFAGVFRAPTIFLLRNNGWAISVPAEHQTASRTYADKGVGYGVPAVRVRRQRRARRVRGRCSKPCSARRAGRARRWSS